MVVASKKQDYLVAFDLDRTLLSVNSSHLVVKHSRRNGIMSNREFLQAIYFSIVYQFDLKNAHEILSSMMFWLNGVKESVAIELARDQVVPEMLRQLRPSAVAELERHRAQCAHLLLLSSALPYLCLPVAEHLGMDDVVCSSLEVIDGHFTGKPNGKLVYGKEKEKRLTAYCNSHGFSPSRTWYYGDAWTDRHILQRVGNPVCVSPEIKLGLLARRKGWKVIR